MPARTNTITDQTVEQVTQWFQTASYWFGDRWCPAVCAKGGGYQIRVIKRDTRVGDRHDTTYDYFHIDSTGLVVESPRGYAKDFTKRVRITDIAEVAEQMTANPDHQATKLRLGF